MTQQKSGFNHKYNTDDVLIRTVIVGLINALNDKITIKNVLSDTVSEPVKVPFFYAFSGDERFMQDYFTDWSDCTPNMIEGNYDPIPRGSIIMTGINILSGQLTSRFVRGYKTKEEEGELRQYNSYLNSIPIGMNFSVTIMVDNVIDSFKITQEIMKIFYKTLVFRVNFDGTVVPTQVGFPESYTNTKLFDYVYGESNRTTITFDLELETYYPIFDQTQEMKAQSTIQNIQVNVDCTPPTNSSAHVDILDITQQSIDTSTHNDTMNGPNFGVRPSSINRPSFEGYWE